MRILFTIPHFYRAKPDSLHGSEQADSGRRSAALRATLLCLHQTFGRGQAHIARPGTRNNERISAELDVVICTAGDSHLLGDIPTGLFRHEATDAKPRLLGYECHRVLAGAIGGYDFYCFAEDDILIDDALFFWKLDWFSGGTGPDLLLQPNRFEVVPDLPVCKLYIDGPLVDPSLVSRLQVKAAGAPVVGKVLGREVAFERAANPHSGCFFLNADQMRRWREQPYFLDRSEAFWGPLESAATLGIMRTFTVYKPAAANAGFLEVRHLDEQYLGKRVVYRAADSEATS